MRLRSVSIRRYKNLADFSLAFEGSKFIDIFVGKNGSGKSNLLEALIDIFDHLYAFSPKERGPQFEYKLAWDIDGTLTEVEWSGEQLKVNSRARTRKGALSLPEHIIVYYSGQNDTVPALTDVYRQRYRRAVRKTVADIPRIISIGPRYKALLLALMLMLPEQTRGRQYIFDKLGITKIGPRVWLKLRRPDLGRKKKPFDPLDPSQVFWGVSGIARTFLNQLLQCITGAFTVGQLYSRETDTYRLELDIARFRQTFAETPSDQIFGLFNALHSLGMLEDMSVEIEGADGTKLDSRAFSDGQFQSIYLFAISELFKDRECLTLLDEPDAFLHPEWQYQFLDQIHAISAEANRSNHILMSSHSPSTIAAQSGARIRQFESDGVGVQAVERNKTELINVLSAGLIAFSEQEARLNIVHNVKSTTKPILFTEGISDEIILETAWKKLNPDVEAPFEVQQAFDRGFLRNLMQRKELFELLPDRVFFALFDFDEAYGDWDQLGEIIETDPARGLARKLKSRNGYALLLPAPLGLSARDQAIDPDTGNTYGNQSTLSIEMLFVDAPGMGTHFEVDAQKRTKCLVFRGDKVDFATKIVRHLPESAFEHFKPLFEFVVSKTS